jgi:hypothetical protein
LNSILKKSKEIIEKKKMNILDNENKEQINNLSDEELKYRMMAGIVKDFYYKLKQKGYSQFFKHNLINNSKYNQYNKKVKVHLPKLRSYST